MNARGFTLIELTLAIALSSLVLLALARLTRAAADERLAWARAEAAIERERFFDALAEALFVGDSPDTPGRVDIVESGIEWAIRGRGRMALRHDPLDGTLKLGTAGTEGAVLFRHVRDFSAELKDAGRVLRIAWSDAAADATVNVERELVLR